MRFKAPSITRRGLFKTTAATGLAAAAVGLMAGCTHGPSEGEDEPVVVDTSKANYVIDPNTNESNFKYVDLALAEQGSVELPMGTVLRPSEGNWIAATSAGSEATPVIKGTAFSVASGTLADVVSTTMKSGDPNVAIYDVRCSDSAYAWVEMNLLDKSWVLYAAPFSEGTLAGTPSTLWKANKNWDPPRVTVTGNKVIWLVMPSLSGTKTSKHSFCYLWELGGSDAKAVVESPGRFATWPEVSEATVTLVPRVNADKGVYYGITAYSVSDNLTTVEDRLVLPQTVSPMRAVRVGEKFAFSIEASYASGGLLGSMGTYIGSSEGKFLVLSREPSAEVCMLGKDYLIKSRSSYFVVDPDAETYATLPAANRSLDYGDFPARDGSCDTFVTFSTVKDPETGRPAKVAVRTFGFASDQAAADASDQTSEASAEE